MYGIANMENKPAQDQTEGMIERQLLPLLPSPGKPDPNSDDPEMPEPLAFSTDDPGSEPDALVTGLVVDVAGAVDPGLYPTVELKDEIAHHTHHCNTNKSSMLLECKNNNLHLDGEAMDDAKTQVPEPANRRCKRNMSEHHTENP
jgi:hypothetical protein